MTNPNNVAITIEVPGGELPNKFSVDPKTFALALRLIDYHCDLEPDDVDVEWEVIQDCFGTFNKINEVFKKTMGVPTPVEPLDASQLRAAGLSGKVIDIILRNREKNADED